MISDSGHPSTWPFSKLSRALRLKGGGQGGRALLNGVEGRPENPGNGKNQPRGFGAQAGCAAPSFSHWEPHVPGNPGSRAHGDSWSPYQGVGAVLQRDSEQNVEGGCDHPMALICHLHERSGPFDKMARPRGLGFLIPERALHFLREDWLLRVFSQWSLGSRSCATESK